MRQIKVDLISESDFSVQGHGVHTAFVEMRDSLNKQKNIDLSVNTRRKDADIVHIHTIGLYSLRHLLRRRVKKVVVAHLLSDSFVGSLKGARVWKPLADWWLRFFYNRADVVQAVSTYTVEGLQEMGIKKPIELIYNSIDSSRYTRDDISKRNARSQLGISDDDFVVLGVGQVQPRKRVDLFVEMALKLPQVSFMWVGGIPFRSVSADAGKMGKLMKNTPSNLTFPGIVPLETMPVYFQAADAFVLPSEQETFGLVVVEAASAGLPIVLRDLHDYDDTFRGDVLLVKSDQEFIDSIQKLSSDNDYYHQIAQKSKRIASRFDSNASARKLVDLYIKLLDT